MVLRSIAAHNPSRYPIPRKCPRSPCVGAIFLLCSKAKYSAGARMTSSKASTVSNPLPASFLRGGTSKGVFLQRSDLPEDRADWARIFLGIMGSPDREHGRQLNGMGGGVSSLSKICVIGVPGPESSQTLAYGDVEEDGDAVDVEYTFAQVGIRDAVVDHSGNCGNLSSMIGVYAVDEGLCKPHITIRSSGGKERRVGTVRSLNLNTRKRVDTSFPVDDDGKAVLDLRETTMAGVPGQASLIDLHFAKPAGARTGVLLPSGRATDSLTFEHLGQKQSILASLVDAANPSVFVLANDLGRILTCQPAEIDYSEEKVETLVEAIRQSGARAMGLDPTAQAQPKISILAPSSTGIIAHSFSMGVLHKAIPMTLGLCLGVAARTEGTLAWELLRECPADSEPAETIRIQHPSGDVDVGAAFDSTGGVESAKVVRTGRRLMKGWVWW